MTSTNDAPIGVGLIGYGLAGQIFHAPLIAAAPGLELRAVATSRTVPGVSVHADPLALIADPAVDLVVIASPNDTHFPLAMAAIDAGKAVVVDKPFTIDLAQADALIAASSARGTMLTVFQNRRWDGDYLTVKALLDSGRLGRVALAEMHWDRFRPAIKPGWREQPGDGAGLMNDLGPHLIDQALQLFGAPLAVSADVAAQRQGAQVDDYFRIELRYDRLRVTLSSMSLATAPRPRFALYGDAGAFIKHGIDAQEAQLKAGLTPADADFGSEAAAGDGIFVAPDGSRTTIPTQAGQYARFYPAVAGAMRRNDPAPVDPASVRLGMAVLAAARESAASGQLVTPLS